LKDCWAFATDAIANANTPAINAARDGTGFVEKGEVMMTSSMGLHPAFGLFDIEH